MVIPRGLDLGSVVLSLGLASNVEGHTKMLHAFHISIVAWLKITGYSAIGTSEAGIIIA